MSGEETPSRPSRPKRIEFYTEDSFKDANLMRSVHIGWGVVGGLAMILGCMGMSFMTQSSWNVSFLWLQRRVGCQFGTLSYMVTSNLLYYHDGDRWVTRDWKDIMERFQRKRAAGTGVSQPQMTQ